MKFRMNAASLIAAAGLVACGNSGADPEGEAALEPAEAPAAIVEDAVVVPASADAAETEPASEPETVEPALIIVPEDDASFVERFGGLNEAEWYVADGWGVPAALNDTLWSRSAIAQTGPGLRFTAAAVEHPDKSFSGASIERMGRVKYGRYETIMTAAKGDGLVSAFFTYTGPHFDTEQHEIDFEFLGKDTTQVQLNYYVRGQGGNETMIDLGYDANTTANLYAFEWAPDAIRWYIGDVLVHEVRGNEDSLPSVAGMAFSQLWAGGPPTKEWLGQPVRLDAPVMTVDCISFRSAENPEAPQCSDGYEGLNTATPNESVR
ncbi:MAG: family 16 glycosylhydrolase [Pseudomonadota bacterium]